MVFIAEGSFRQAALPAPWLCPPHSHSHFGPRAFVQRLSHFASVVLAGAPLATLPQWLQAARSSGRRDSSRHIVGQVRHLKTNVVMRFTLQVLGSSVKKLYRLARSFSGHAS